MRAFVAIAMIVSFALPAAAENQRRVEAEHIIFMWDEGGLDADGVEVAKERCEHFYGVVAEFLGYEPENKVMVLFHGSAERPDGSWGYPRVDLGRRYGDARVVEFAQQDRAGADEDYERFFGKSLAQLEREWREASLAEFAAIDSADEKAARYRSDSPAQYNHVCKAGEDFETPAA